jgi:APA family basic amino acid/polyamine antiporter
MLELSLGAATVAAGWSGYIVGILKSGGVILPQAITAVPSNGGIINLPAIFISLFIAFILVLGTKESKKINIILVAVKLLAILMFLVLAVPFFEISHWDEFMPHGFGGVMTGAAVIFFAYTGFGTIACATEECKNPKRDVMIGIIGSLVVSTIVYMLIAAALTGMAHYSVLGVPDPLAHALRLNGSNLGSALVATGAVAGMTTVILAQMYGQSRIFMVMARDGLLPEAFAKVHPKFNSPHISIIVIGLLVAVVSGFTPINQMSSLCSMGALFDYIIVAIIVMMLRVTKPEVERPFKCPLIFLIATIATMLCLWLFAQLVTTSGLAFTLWVLLGLVVYMCYGRKTSKMRIGA